MRKKTFFTPINSIIKHTFSKQKQLDDIWKLLLIKEIWETLPVEISTNCEPYFFKDNTLSIKVPGTVWKQEIALRKNEIIKFIHSSHPDIFIDKFNIQMKNSDKYFFIEKEEKAYPPPLKVQKPTPGSPAWKTIVAIRERAKAIDKPWTKYFIHMTDLFLDN